MKKIILIIVIVIVVGLVAWGIWFFVVSKNATTNSSSGQTSSGGSLPATPSSLPPRVQSKTESGASVYIQNISSPQDSGVASGFLNQIQNADQIALGGTIVASSYALQIWGDSNKGGEALLENPSSTGWTLISLGGGEWSVLALIQEGVPISAAEQLVAGLNKGAAAAPGGSPIAIPPGATISIGTAEGTVTMNNFYNNAAYLDQDEQAVVVQQSSTYSFIYSIPNSSFTITITRTPFEAARQTAEAAFLNVLGISQFDACKLNVTINTPYNIDSNPADQGLGLSFCGGGAFQTP